MLSWCDTIVSYYNHDYVSLTLSYMIPVYPLSLVTNGDFSLMANRDLLRSIAHTSLSAQHQHMQWSTYHFRLLLFSYLHCWRLLSFICVLQPVDFQTPSIFHSTITTHYHKGHKLLGRPPIFQCGQKKHYEHTSIRQHMVKGPTG